MTDQRQSPGRDHSAIFSEIGLARISCTDIVLTPLMPLCPRVTVLPFRLGPTHSQPRREVQSTIQRPTPVQTPIPPMPPSTQSNRASIPVEYRPQVRSLEEEELST